MAQRRSGVPVRAVLAGLAVVSMLGVSACGSKPTAPPTTQVQRGSVSTMVSASGSLSALTSQDLGFSNAAKLIELDVKVGDTVKPGQILAKEDPFSFNQALNQARANLAGGQAKLTELIQSPAVPGSRAVVEQSKRILDATRDSVDAQVDAARNTRERAQVALRFARTQLQTAADKYRSDGCGNPNDVLHGRSHTHSGGLLGGMAPPAGTCDSPPVSNPTGAPPRAADTSALTTAYTNFLSAKTSYLTAKRGVDTAQASGRITIRQAQASVISNQNALDVNRTNRPSDIAAQRAAVANLVSLVAVAQHNVDNSILYAPVGGNVSAITGAVGEYLPGSSSGNTALAPGTDAAIPGVGAAATSDQSGNASSGISATRPGGGAFIVLNNINSYQVVVPFEESDAAKVQPNQKVQVTFDAIPDLQLPGTVLSIAPNGVNISGVTNYYATILLTGTDPRLKAGQTAEASVVTNSLDNVLVVPNSAVIKQGASSYVNVPGPNGQPTRQQFTPGAVGDDNTQVLSGLSEGQEILLPQAGGGTGTGTVNRGSTGGGGGGGGH
ncbi:MAG TPA: HlyD family efflux transporter periplasmic adaptor subunit [Pseudonocardia sp.]